MITTQQRMVSKPFFSVQANILQRKCACGNHTITGGECADCAKKKMGLQRKLTIGASNDPLEQEADRIADQVMASSSQSAVSGAPVKVQRFTGNQSGQEMKVPPSVERVLASPGQPLESGLREEMEGRFGYDFSQVQVHTGSAAEQSAREVNARAYTVGNNVVFGAGKFAPGTHEGQRLIAHELTHVVQQQFTNVESIQREDDGPNGGKVIFSNITEREKYVLIGGNGQLTPGPNILQGRQYSADGFIYCPRTGYYYKVPDGCEITVDSTQPYSPIIAGALCGVAYIMRRRGWRPIRGDYTTANWQNLCTDDGRSQRSPTMLDRDISETH